MRAVVARVTRAAVHVEGATVGEIGPGLLVLLGIHRDDPARGDTAEVAAVMRTTTPAPRSDVAIAVAMAAASVPGVVASRPAATAMGTSTSPITSAASSAAALPSALLCETTTMPTLGPGALTPDSPRPC